MAKSRSKSVGPKRQSSGTPKQPHGSNAMYELVNKLAKHIKEKHPDWSMRRVMIEVADYLRPPPTDKLSRQRRKISQTKRK